ncbi:DUF2927 domain-containing protein [Aestuariivita sp.]|jgi:hypothetical protein|uniref:DUF2927 domain-containing protein n=1 Tax=Aestuariivita sp. TaxID=1872407 RepID=UPI00216C0276|nr:DUF2927 domain-containing protein [Aestuariivita sp.]MCE8009254.1 DUF2927 domain-containing protein [Aestuariivita sp.]
MNYFALLSMLALAACAAAPVANAPATRAMVADSALPPMKVFSAPRPVTPQMSNGNIAADFLSLHFQLESGRTLPVFTRFEGPVTVGVTGQPPDSLGPDLARLLSRLRSEAQVDIRQVGPDAPEANIVIEAVSRTDIRQALPQAACFVVPNVTSLAEYRRFRRSDRINWARLTERQQMAIFLPYDASPQEVRDCLHEELAQALGPLNDLYRLRESVFNDDNVHNVLTGFDMLILRATYAPSLRSGMTREEVAARLPRILSTLNPGGDGLGERPQAVTPRNWITAVQAALDPGTGVAQRRSAATDAMRIAQDLNWSDHRRAFSHYIVGRLIQGYDPDLAQRHFAIAQRYFDETPGTELHQAYLAAQTAAYAITRGDGDTALRKIAPALPVARNAENAALLATLMLLQAEAYTLTGQHETARAVRLDSLGWARYGFGSDWAVRAKMREISGLTPAPRS